MDFKSVRVRVCARVRVRVRVLVCGLLLFNFFFGFGTDAQPLLPQQEVRALEAISAELKILNWSVHQNSCNNPDVAFANVKINDATMRVVNCTCSNVSCSVTNIQLKTQNLVGVLPAAFANLTQLRQLDLTRNFINGSIPKEFGRLPLFDLSMLGNRLSGPIPPEIGDIASLQQLVLEHNQLRGNLPESLGKLSRLNKLFLSANNFTGPIPESYGNLNNLTEFRIDGNGISGKLPEFIGNWINLQRLDVQGTSMETPIPDAISELKNLTELRISDLKGQPISFPNLTQLTSLETLVLRNCIIEDKIPDYFDRFSRLRTLDLSFNRLNGTIPEPLQSLSTRDNRALFLNDNLLTGQVPNWIGGNKANIDLSYNNFTGSPVPTSCQQSKVNLVSSYSSATNQSVTWCLKGDLPCTREDRSRSLFINCGGEEMEFDGNLYERDMNNKDDESIFFSTERWGYSSTGIFMDNNSEANYLTSSSVSTLGVYRTARFAPVSLRYYGFCLESGSYNVKLHFAETMFTADQTFSSLGKRIFDISIQGNLVEKDFNIVERARGVDKSFVLEVPNVIVTGSTLEIHLYWAGKGTMAIPYKWVYGPLISAITVASNFGEATKGISAGAIAGIVVGIFVFVVLVLVVLRRKGYLGGKETEDKGLRDLKLQTNYFSLSQIKTATKNFDSAYKIGEGGFGPVYKGVLSDGSSIAVKQLSSKSRQGNREFITEIGMISALQHPNLVKLYGCCIEGNQLLLIYEYLENNNLARALFSSKEHSLHLDWPVRMKICLGIAKGLAYLHEESRLKIVHRDIKATNVLLDGNLNAKISDFGLAKLDDEENTHINTRIAGTIGYMAPEYATRGYLTDKADVYSFGIVALEIVSGKSNTSYRPKEECVYLLDWAIVLQEEGNLLKLVDPSLGLDYSKEEAMRMIRVALVCTNQSSTLRPSMSSVVSMLEGKIAVEVSNMKHNVVDRDERFRVFEKLSQDSLTSISTTTSQGIQMQGSIIIDGPWIDSSSTSTQNKDESTREYSSSSSLLRD